MTENIIWLKFQDCNRLVALHGCSEILDLVPKVLPNWPVEIVETEEPVPMPFLAFTKADKKFAVLVETSENAKVYSDPVDAICEGVVELAWETLRTNQSWLCLHCAAVEFGKNLVVFPNIYRSGKSTLSASLAKQGHRIFTDDFLALEAVRKDIVGIASGVNIRMRKPWPSCISSSFRNWLETSDTAHSDRYSYHIDNNITPVKRGERASISSFVLLNREEGAQARLDVASKSDMLQAIVKQNFSRAINSAWILQALHYLVSNRKLFWLTYSDPEDAASELGRWFGGDNNIPSPQMDTRQLFETSRLFGEGATKTDVCVSFSDLYKRKDSVLEYEADGIRFIADGAGIGIYKLDGLSAGIWNLLKEPISLGDIIELLQVAFPSIARAQIAEDVRGLIYELLQMELIEETPSCSLKDEMELRSNEV